MLRGDGHSHREASSPAVHVSPALSRRSLRGALSPTPQAAKLSSENQRAAPTLALNPEGNK